MAASCQCVPAPDTWVESPLCTNDCKRLFPSPALLIHTLNQKLGVSVFMPCFLLECYKVYRDNKTLQTEVTVQRCSARTGSVGVCKQLRSVMIKLNKTMVFFLLLLLNWWWWRWWRCQEQLWGSVSESLTLGRSPIRVSVAHSQLWEKNRRLQQNCPTSSVVFFCACAHSGTFSFTERLLTKPW